MHLKNQSNEYAEQLGSILDECPKAVLAAIAVSTLTCGGDRLSEARALVAKEWAILHANGIVPQAPKRFARAEIAKSEGTHATR